MTIILTSDELDGVTGNGIWGSQLFERHPTITPNIMPTETLELKTDDKC